MTDLAPLWQRRFRAPIVGFPTWSRHAPNRLVYASSESGIYQLHSWDVATGERRQITKEPVGLVSGNVSDDGEWVLWHRDTTGDESGTWMVAPFSGGDAEPLAEGLPRGWDEGLAPGRTRSIAAVSDKEGFGLYAVHANGSTRRIAHSKESIILGGGNAMTRGGHELAGLSADETLVAIEHGEHGDLIHAALRVLDARTGEVVGELHDPDREVLAFAWSPVPGDDRLAIGHERRGERAPAIWSPRTGELHDLALPWDRFTEVTDWWPDGSAVLLVELRDGRDHLHRYDLETDTMTELPTRPGSMTGARVRPDGRLQTIWDRTNVLGSGALTPAGDSIITWVQQDDGTLRSMILATDGSGGRVLLRANEAPGAVSEDGRWLSYSLRADGGNDLGVLDLASGATKRITTTPENEGGEEFTPDGKSLVFRRVVVTQRLRKADLSGLLSPPK